LVRIESVKLDQEFQHQRSTLPDKLLEDIPDEDIERICKLWIANVLEEDEEIRVKGLSARDHRKIKETLDIADVDVHLGVGANSIILSVKHRQDSSGLHV